jgi:hypothetical protein
VASTRDLPGPPDRDGPESWRVRIPRQAPPPMRDAAGPAVRPPGADPVAREVSDRLLDRILQERPTKEPPAPAALPGASLAAAPATPPTDARPLGRRTDPLMLLLGAAAALLAVAGLAVLGTAALQPGTHPATVAAAAATAAAGADGVVPGGPPVVVAVGLATPAGRRLAVTSIRPDASSLPLACPASLWSFAPAAAPRRADARVAVAVSLAPQAPSTCQGLTAVLPVTVTARRPDGTTVRSAAAVPLAVARLGTPRAAVRVDHGRLVVQGTASPTGPSPTAFTVDAVRPDGSREPVCREHSLLGCVDGHGLPATERRYVLTAWRGAWHAVSATVTAWTPPPAPRVDLPGGPLARIRAAEAGGDWTLTVLVDGHRAADLTVRAGTDLDGDVPLGRLSPGTHRVEVVATAHGLEQATEAHLTIRGVAG